MVEAEKEMRRLSKSYVLSFIGRLIIIACGLMLGIAGVGSYSGALFILFAILGGILLFSGIMVVSRAAICFFFL